MGARAALLRRHSRPKVTGDAPTDARLLPLIAAASTVADHADLRPWRLIALRGEARERLGAAFVEAGGLEGKAAEAIAAKPLRAPLLIAIVVSYRENFKVHRWEQEAVASGVAHMLTLLLDEAGWGVMWRSGALTRTVEVHRMHGLAENEELLGWLYVGGVDDSTGRDKERELRPEDFLTSL